MYDTRWPRPGPAMAAVAAVLGLVAGIVLGLSSPGSTPAAAARAPTGTTAAPTTTTLPHDFHTVILGSYNNRDNADARLRQVRGMGVKDAGILDRTGYDISTAFAVYSGRYRTQEEARAHREDLAQYGIPPDGRFYKHVTRKD
ncbi:MAG TPA: SPOR domain-containing protein [Actinomycetes bacterium]|nr:SPOR domain-containing protein [Actinomycetes bacterium]